MAEPIDILSLTDEELAAQLAELGQPKYRAGQIFTHLMRAKSFDQMQNLPLSLREILGQHYFSAMPTVAQKQVSAIDGTVKFLFALHDGAHVESVLLRYGYGNTLCISTQVGCRMGCRFCASTLGGKIRDLLPSEMLGQVIAASAEEDCRISHVVMMGIGEPLDNYDNTVTFLRLARDPKRLGISPRNISLSTCGVVPGILRLAKEEIPVTLSVSLHAPTDEERSRIMPVNVKYPIAQLLGACRTYFETTGRRISFEYTLIAGVNDSPEQAGVLAGVLRRHLPHMPIHVNLIRLNRVKEREFEGGSTESAHRFAKALEKHGIVATLRRRLGADIDAACGQLRRKTEHPSTTPIGDTV